MRRSWAWLGKHGESVKITFLVIAGIFVLAEYKAKDYLSRVQNSSDVIEKYFRGEEHQALARLENFRWSDFYLDKKQSLEGAEITSQEFRKAVTDEVRKSHIPDILKSIKGLKTVSICAIQGRCEASSICMHLAQSMQDLRCDFRDTIAQLSKSNGSCVIDEVNYFVDTYCTQWMSSYLGVQNYRNITDNICLFDMKTRTSKIGEYCTRSIIYKRPGGLLSFLFD